MDLGLTTRRPEEFWRRVLFVWKRDGDPTINDEIMGIINLMKKELIRRGLSVYVYDKEDTYGSNVAIVFVTKDFLIDCYRNRAELRRWFGPDGGKRCIIICDNNERKFESFVRRFCAKEDFQDADPNYLIEHGISHVSVLGWLGTTMAISTPKYRKLIHGISHRPAEVQDFVTKSADDVEQALKPMGLDFANMDRNLKSDVLDIYDHLLLQRKRIPKDSDDFLVVVFAGCQCHCFDNTIISRMIDRHQSSGIMKFAYSFTLSNKEYDDIENDPLTLQKALIRKIYSKCTPGDYLNFHQKCGSRYKYFVRVEDFDVSNPHAQEQLKNIAALLGRKSLVIITTNASSELLETKMCPVSRVRGTTCKNDTNILTKCYRIFISKLIELNKKEVHTPPDDKCSNKVCAGIELDNELETQSAGKKLKTNYPYMYELNR